MQEIPFSIPVSGIIRLDEGIVTVVINRVETTVSFEPISSKPERISLEKGKTLFDVVLETAREVISITGENRFSAAQLYNLALERYPALKRNSWGSHVVACANNHPSQKYSGSKRDYFRYLGDGTYSLKDTYFSKSDINNLSK